MWHLTQQRALEAARSSADSLSTVWRALATAAGAADSQSTVPPRVAEIRERLKEMGGGSVSLTLPPPTDNTTAGEVAVITINNHERRNALSGRMMCQLLDAVETLDSWRGSGLILTGDGGFFCAGADLKTAQKYLMDSNAGADMSTFMHYVTQRLRSLPQVSVAAIEGAAVGGGAELTTSCDFRVVADNAFIHFVHAKMAVTPGWGGGTRLTRIVGRREALKLLCGAQKASASHALSIGLCDAMAPQGKAVDMARDFLQQFTKHHSDVTRAMKRVVSHADDSSLIPSLAHEQQVFSSLWASPLNAQAVSSGGMTSKKTQQ
eukprot:comp16901_c0_seq1/m.15430 comp16901_c0_seq1/g.15430  ORF comp16901_c0_seq1/g.15430 comp16901_c0_seq1/m.15430 type:complete len:320 (-) comp16901_c0_seq1:471-1430(-)